MPVLERVDRAAPPRLVAAPAGFPLRWRDAAPTAEEGSRRIEVTWFEVVPPGATDARLAQYTDGSFEHVVVRSTILLADGFGRGRTFRIVSGSHPDEATLDALGCDLDQYEHGDRALYRWTLGELFTALRERVIPSLDEDSGQARIITGDESTTEADDDDWFTRHPLTSTLLGELN